MPAQAVFRTNPEHDLSLTTTLFLGVRLDQNTQLYFDPEIAGGRRVQRRYGYSVFS
jgi:hypothetical protein